MPKKRVKLGKYKTVFKGILFSIKQAKAEWPSGKKGVFEIIERPPSVIVLAIDSKKRLLLTREFRRKHGKIMWFLAAGRMDKKGESAKQAAQRELQEETGFKAKKLKFFHKSVVGNSIKWEIFSFIATGLEKAALQGDEDEDIKVVPTPISKAFRMVLEGKVEDEKIAFLIIKLYTNRKKLGL